MGQIQDITDGVRRFGADLRDRRRAAGLSQVAVAGAAGVGRSTLINLEQGRQDVRLSNALAIAEALGAALTIVDEARELTERRRARAEEDFKLARRREAHLGLAVDLALARPRAKRALLDAREAVELWKRERTCSAFYIDGWSKVLKGDAAQVARRIRSIDPQWLDAMLQNTPFSRAVAPA